MKNGRLVGLIARRDVLALSRQRLPQGGCQASGSAKIGYGRSR